MAHHLAQLNIARMVAPLDDPAMREFVDALEPINALADASPGFVWRLQDEAGDATSIRAFEDPSLLVNLSVWDDLNALKQFVYKSAHVRFLRDRGKWFHRLEGPSLVLWWIERGHIPTLREAKQRLQRLADEGPTEHAFTLAQSFPPSDHGATIRAGMPSDAERLTEVAHAAKRHWGYPEGWITLWRRALSVSGWYVQEHPVFVAERGGDIAGFVALAIDGPDAEVDHLWVLPEYMGGGVGRALVSYALGYCSDRGVERIEVASDPNATGFYEKMGARLLRHIASIPAPRKLPVLEFDLTRR